MTRDLWYPKTVVNQALEELLKANKVKKDLEPTMQEVLRKAITHVTILLEYLEVSYAEEEYEATKKKYGVKT